MTEENLQSVRTCLECGQPLGPGRSDSKFCNDLCRTAFNNRRRTEDTAETANGANNVTPLHQKVFAIILHNRNLLEKAYYYYDDPVFLKSLLAEGFNLNSLQVNIRQPTGQPINFAWISVIIFGRTKK